MKLTINWGYNWRLFGCAWFLIAIAAVAYGQFALPYTVVGLGHIAVADILKALSAKQSHEASHE